MNGDCPWADDEKAADRNRDDDNGNDDNKEEDDEEDDSDAFIGGNRETKLRRLRHNEDTAFVDEDTNIIISINQISSSSCSSSSLVVDYDCAVLVVRYEKQG